MGSNDARQISLTVDERTLQSIEELKRELNVTSTAAVIRRALALARFAARSADEDNMVTILDKDRKENRIFLES